jgi:hypothetical protein
VLQRDGGTGRLRGLCPTILRHNADGLSHSGRGQLKQARSTSPVAETTGAETGGDWGRFGLPRSYVYGWKVLAGVVGNLAFPWFPSA